MEAVAQTKNLQIDNNVVMMLPSSIRCIACRNVMAKGTMFNSRKEEAANEEFCPWKDRKFIFYFNYTQCSAEIVILIRTNQRYSGLVVEAGASNYYGHETPWLGLPCVIEKEPLVPYRDPNWQEKRDKLFGASLFNMVPDLELNGTLHKSTVSYTELLLNTVESGKQLGESVTGMLLSFVCP